MPGPVMHSISDERSHGISTQPSKTLCVAGKNSLGLTKIYQQ